MNNRPYYVVVRSHERFVDWCDSMGLDPRDRRQVVYVHRHDQAVCLRLRSDQIIYAGGNYDLLLRLNSCVARRP